MKDLKEIDFKKDKLSIENYFDERLKFVDVCKKDNVCNYIFPKTYSQSANYNEDLNEFIGTKKNIIYIGAKFGLEVMMLAKPDTNFIYCFEPLYFNYSILKQNQIMNKLTNVIPYQAFVGDENTFELYHSTEDTHLGLLGFNDEIPVIKLDDYEFQDVGLIYIDQSQLRFIEKALKGAKETILEHNPEIIIDSNLDQPKAFLKKLGYKDVGLEYNQRGGRFIKNK
jgi:FkbM family methyltransferase